MIGRFNIDSPPIDDSLSQMVESHRAKTGQDYGAILLFGLWGTVDCSAEVRLYAAYRHLESNPEDGPAWLETARVHQEQGETEQAFAILDELERLGTPGLYPNLFSEDPEAHRAAILADSGRLDAALEILDRLRAEHGETPAYHYLVGTILQEQENWTGAVAAYEEAAAALDDFRREAEEEDVIEEMSVDFPAAREFIAARIGAATR
ncbi:MAG: tetratricopeptide repeat protein, partial [Planctomycetes bacterium]|nr:tetratricopeptide repeat protein [Planctomycetota bacterium]